MRSLKCESCGANLSVEEDREFGFCQYCGAKYILNETLNINVSIDNKNKEKLKSASDCIVEGNFEKAEKLYKNILQDDNHCHEAWWGRFLCERYYSSYYGYTNRYGETSKQIKKDIINNNLYFAYKAIENAPADMAKFYKDHIVAEENFLNS